MEGTDGHPSPGLSGRTVIGMNRAPAMGRRASHRVRSAASGGDDHIGDDHIARGADDEQVRALSCRCASVGFRSACGVAAVDGRSPQVGPAVLPEITAVRIGSCPIRHGRSR